MLVREQLAVVLRPLMWGNWAKTKILDCISGLISRQFSTVGGFRSILRPQISWTICIKYHSFIPLQLSKLGWITEMSCPFKLLLEKRWLGTMPLGYYCFTLSGWDLCWAVSITQKHKIVQTLKLHRTFIQAYLGEIAGLGLDHCSKTSIAVKWVVIFLQMEGLPLVY